MKERKWIGTICKIVFWVVAFFLVIFTVLFNLGGANDTYKQTIEQYLAESSGYHATIGKFNAMTFFPTLGLDFEDMQLRVNPGDANPVAGADRITLSFDFLDAAFSTGKINTINIENFYAQPGVVFGKSLQIERASIEDYGKGTAIFRVEGQIGQESLQAETDMEVFGEGSSAKYKFGSRNRLLLVAGDARIEAVLEGTDTGTRMDGFKAVLRGTEVISGTGHLVGQRQEKNLRLTGDLSVPQYGTLFNPDLRFEFGAPGRIRGTVKSPDFYLADFEEGSRLREFADYLASVFASDMPPRMVMDTKVTLSVEKLHTGTDVGPPVEKTFESRAAPVNVESFRDFIAALPAEIKAAAP